MPFSTPRMEDESRFAPAPRTTASSSAFPTQALEFHGPIRSASSSAFTAWMRRDRAKWAGRGWGLCIAKHIVEAHGGRIWVESTVGQGSDFYFSVPVA